MTYSSIFKSLRNTIQEKKDTVIFTDTVTGKFIQYALDYSDEKTSMTLDIPLAQCTESERIKLSELLSGKATNVLTNKDIAFQEYFWAEEIEKATKISHKIFLEVFMSKPDYDVDIEIF